MCTFICAADLRHDAFFVLEEEAINDLVTHVEGDMVEQCWEASAEELPELADLMIGRSLSELSEIPELFPSATSRAMARRLRAGR